MTPDLRKTGIDVLGSVPWGTHFCHFYQTRDDLVDLLIPYFQVGLENHEFCFWVVAHPLTEQEAKDALRRALPDADQRLTAGDIEIVSDDSFLRDGSFNTAKILDGLKDKLAWALTAGYSGMRVNGSGAWLTEKDRPSPAEFENRLNHAIANEKIIFACGYPLETTNAGQLFDIVRSHRFALARRDGSWEVLETLQLEAEAARRQAEEKYRSIFDNATEGIFQSTPEGTFFSANPALARILGYATPEELIADHAGIRIQHFVDASCWEHLERLLARDNVATGFECEMVRKDLTRTWVVQNIRAILDEKGAVAYYEGSVEDISRRKTLEDQLRQAHKMEAVGQLAGGIAHDFNNLLTVINGYAALALANPAAAESVRKDLSEVLNAGERAALLTQRLLAFSRQQVLSARLVDLNTVVSEIQPILRRLIQEDIEVELHLSPEPVEVKADPAQLEQVILNLAVNARDAMPQGGRLTIETANVRLDESYARSHPDVTPGSYALLVVSDNGVGISESTKARMFEPFFTTKAVGKGTGLGLAVVYGVVRQSGGHVSVESEPGAGATFRIYLASANEPTEKLADAAPRAPLPDGRETVLLVEDDDAVRGYATKILAGRGYTVIPVRNGEEALGKSATFSGRIDLLVTDVIMPGMSGPEVASRLELERPGLSVLYISGYAVDEIDRHGVLAPGVALLTKPFSPEKLAEKVRETLLGAEEEAAWRRHR